MDRLSKIAAAPLITALLLTTALSFVGARTAAAQTPTPPAPAPAPAQEDDRRVLRGEKTVIGSNFTLASDQTLDGDLAIVGGNVTLAPGSIVRGDVIMLGGNLVIGGEVSGDVTLLGGTINIKRSAVIAGKLDSLGGTLEQEPGAKIGERGNSVVIPVPPVPPVAPVPPVISTPVRPDVGSGDNEDRPRSIGERIRRALRKLDTTNWNPDVEMGFGQDNEGKVIPGSILITLLAMVIAAIAPRNIAMAAQQLREQPLLSAGVGFLTLVAGSIVLGATLLLIVTICTNPLIALAAIGAGWTVTARIAGEYVMNAVKRSAWQPLMQILVGSFVIALLGAIPIVGDVLGMFFVAFGLGALVLTRGGTQLYSPLRNVGLPPAS